jgi:fatty acid desaturase
MKRIDKSWRQISRLHSIRLAIGSAALWSAIGGAIMIWPALAGDIPLGAYIAGGIALSIAFGVARLLKQPGAE